MWYMMMKDLPSSIASQGQEAGCLRIFCSDMTSSGQSRSRNTQGRCFSRDRRMEYCQASLSGMMYALSEPIIRTLRTISKDSGQSGTGSSSQGDSLAWTSASQEEEQGSRVGTQGFTLRWKGSFAKCDLDTCSLRTLPCLLSEDSREYSRDLPRWGMMRDGVLSELTMQAPPIRGRDFGCGASGKPRHIPTPTVMDANGYSSPRSIMKEDNFRGVSLKYLVERIPEKLWPTPTASDWKRVNPTDGYTQRHDWCLPMAAKYGVRRKEEVTFPTPGTTGLSNGSAKCEKANRLYAEGVISEEERRSFRAGNGGKLSPYWTAWLMGWPLNWCDIEEDISPKAMENWKYMVSEYHWWDIDPAEEGDVPRTVEECPQRTAQLKCLGNGQVPLVAAMAMILLSREVAYD